MTEQQRNDPFTQRVCLALDGMDAVVVEHNVPYAGPDPYRVLDVFHPLEGAAADRPAVVVVCGYPPRAEPQPGARTYKDFGWTVSMAQLIAVSGIVAVTYAAREPANDLRAVFLFLRTHASSLGIDPSRIGVMAVSGNVPTALSTLISGNEMTPACAVFGYGYLLDFDGATDVAEAAATWGFANPCAGRSFDDLRNDVPLFISRAGRDQFPGVSASIDRFVRAAILANMPIEFINHRHGPHAFDLFDDGRISRNIVRGSLDFLQRHLADTGQKTAI